MHFDIHVSLHASECKPKIFVRVLTLNSTYTEATSLSEDHNLKYYNLLCLGIYLVMVYMWQTIL